ncbi:MAG TPA: chemotaxis response regulator protein-glutamate methylesterase [Nitrospiria bacterium]|nr:chemotaxis response regulator protein-glutamate methylesterase [Nitrospiria bacterium]HUK56498.1 chemotaxis response regulator protein-glutamate methylesterase [Nitrospiria bacterium]
MNRIKVLIVDDSAFYRQTLTGILKTSPHLDVVGAVPNGSEAIRFVSRSKPDVITLDLEMPTMDGFTFLRWLMANMPLPVVVISSRSESNNVFKALELGAVDFIGKPTQRASLEIMKLRTELVSKVETAATISSDKVRLKYKEGSIEAAVPLVSDGARDTGSVRVVAIGASTGGPPAIQSIISKLPKDFPAAVIVAQHMPPGFTLYFAERLDKFALLPVKEAAPADRIEPGRVYISPGGYHMELHSTPNGVQIGLKFRADLDKYAPSVDRMMISAAEIYGEKVLGILLTGMGSDGKAGMKAIKEKGGITIAEAEETCVVFGMPKEAIGIGVVDKVLPLDQIPLETVRRCLA